MKVGKKQHEMICRAICNISVADGMMGQALQNGDNDKWERWHDSKQRAIAALEDAGIHYHQWLREAK